MPPGHPPEQAQPGPRLQHPGQRILALTNVDDVLAAACREVIAATGAARACASCCAPNQAWERGTHLEADADGRSTPLVGAARSALFAIHRRLSVHRGPLTLRHDGSTDAIFRGLRCPADVTAIHAFPIVHRTGRVWGELVVIGSAPVDVLTARVDEIARFATIALENAQRLAFARRDQDRLLLLAEATSDALYDWDFDSREFWWGGGILKLLGSDADPVENAASWKLDQIHPDDVEAVRSALDTARAGRSTTWNAEYRFRRHDGTYIEIEDRGYFLREPSGRAYRMIGSMRDVTAMKLLFASEQRARAEAESASRTKDEFLAMLGHELRNPLAPIVSGLQLLRLRAGRDDDKQLDVLERQAQHLIRLVDDLLDISRIAHGKIELRKERLDVAAVVASAIETARPLLEARAHNLHVDVPRGLEVDGDRARLAQAIANLLTNAAKYTDPRGDVTVRARRDGDDVTISVRDSGTGIAPDVLPNIFKMFVQERQALDRSQGGLGLGLAIVKSLVELHGGSVAAHSAGRGHGSELTVRIPAAPAVIVADHDPAIQRAPRAGGRRVLVVDDNEDAADLLSMLLEELGNTTRVANHPLAALEMVDDFAPDIAVLDIGLPVIDGYELARRMRQRPGRETLRLIALTGYGQPSDRERSASAGFNAHLVKPITAELLQAAVDALG